MLLRTLFQPAWGTDVKSVTTTLRTWRRFCKRTGEIGASLPDPTVLLRALEEPMQWISRSDAQAIFRVSQTRAMLEVDSKPSLPAVWSFSECLLAELDSLLLVDSTAETGKEQSTSKTPAVKMVQGPTTRCRFWGSDGGCRLGKKCSYNHDSHCSALNHRKQECPTRPAGDKAPTGGSGGQDSMGHGRGGKTQSSKGGKKGKGDNSQQSEKAKVVETRSDRAVVEPRNRAKKKVSRRLV